jgi:transcriptional regulator with XRE-family HTH domain
VSGVDERPELELDPDADETANRWPPTGLEPIGPGDAARNGDTPPAAPAAPELELEPGSLEAVTGDDVRRWRESSGLYQRDVARLLGVGTDVQDGSSTVSKIERNRQSVPDELARMVLAGPLTIERPPGDEPAGTPRRKPGRPKGSRTRKRPADKAPRATGPPPAPRGEQAELERELLALLVGATFTVPGPDGAPRDAVVPGVATFVGMFDEFDAQVIEAWAPAMAHAWAELAQQNPRVRQILRWMTTGGNVRGVLTVTLPPVVMIAAHHGLVPAHLFGGAAIDAGLGDGSGVEPGPTLDGDGLEATAEQAARLDFDPTDPTTWGPR